MAGQQLVLFYWFWAVTLHYSATSLFHSSEGHKIIMVLHRRYSLFRGMHTPRHFLSIGKCTGIIHFWFCPHLKRLEICQFSKLIVLFIAKTPVYFKFNIVLPPSLKIRIVRHKKLSCCDQGLNYHRNWDDQVNGPHPPRGPHPQEINSFFFLRYFSCSVNATNLWCTKLYIHIQKCFLNIISIALTLC